MLDDFSARGQAVYWLAANPTTRHTMEAVLGARFQVSSYSHSHTYNERVITSLPYRLLRV